MSVDTDTTAAGGVARSACSQRSTAGGLAIRSQALADGWFDAVMSTFAAEHEFGERALTQAHSIAVSMFEHLERCGVIAWSEVTAPIVIDWVRSPVQHPDGARRDPAFGTVRYRQWMARAVFKIAARLGATVDPTTAAGTPIKRPAQTSGPRTLTDHELADVCAASAAKLSTSKQPLLVALSLAGGDAAEVAAVRAKDVNLANGTVTFVGENARVCALDDWSAHQLASYVAANSPAPEERLCVRADTPPDKAAYSVMVRMHQIMRRAGLAGRGSDVSARSIRLTAAQRVLEHGSIADAALFLGSRSLDHTADVLSHDWQRDSPAPVAAPPPEMGN